MTQCYLSDPNSSWRYCPSLAAAILFTILFSIPTGVHAWQAIKYRKPFAWVIIMAGLWEVVGYTFRSISVSNQLDSGDYIAQFLLILLAPLWINAFIYMILGRMLHYYLDHDKVLGLRARKITVLFVLCDILSFTVQLIGGAMSSGNNLTQSQIDTGLHVYIGGIVIQLCFIGTFIVLAIRFQLRLKGQDKNQLETPQAFSPEFAALEGRTYDNARPLMRCHYMAISLVIFRNIYRLVEYTLGADSTITRHEWFQYVFDAVPMLFAIIVLSVWHPGRYLNGPRCDFSEENRARKQAKKDKKAAKKAGKKEGHDSHNDVSREQVVVSK